MSIGATKSKSIIGFAIALDIILLDQLSKWAILEHVILKEVQPNNVGKGLLEWISSPSPRFPPVSIEILPFFNLSMVWNEGISFGMFQGSGIWILSGLALLISAVFAVWLTRATGWLQAISLAMVIGGAVGNVIDRFRFGAVADFFDFHVMGWHYPAFNVADCGITVGIALLLFDGVFLEPKRKAQLEKAVA